MYGKLMFCISRTWSQTGKNLCFFLGGGKTTKSAFSAFFVGSYPPKVDKMSMKVHIFIDFRRQMTYFWSNRSQKHGFPLKNRFYPPPRALKALKALKTLIKSTKSII